ncbi:ubiquinol-cytochrome c reductase complex assembly factor 2 [Aspergillus luchuensis]|uniref:Uncharacterized protein n=8 Tax=Aspergillus subgen. Circumdati TaxID=2720871 RepID=A0A146F9Z2_ASPKA|nr:uncharacterized protein BO83DRAFT_382043 [Aspergillus eucalypticola CBS 122712]XP_025540397.1 hypothetical protein BO79DRAFT_193768 [Aspergillus costaricaensis CBS 115574]XP_041545339.1 uncharacterized protein AKAW2_51918A [Aspergillus luchuensis]OJZ81256.1 hypothetical protein ASPFODRAFT_65222 [Aspergillus luchuensis CBS 106.47]GAA88000.1 hypothetical protein AKAW_06114 [Aspergillus luchuensis IFO 4308]GAQ45204.1 hypothetical protein AKAW_06114 [Aspergillus niger]GLA60053.1 hypothetical p
MASNTQRITTLLKHWPTDKVRPSSVSVQNYLQACLQPSSTEPTSQKQPQQEGQLQKVNIDEKSLNALSSLLEDRYARRYPLSPRLRRPASNPDHYDNVIREFDEAPDRDWMGRLKKRLGGLLRLR